MIHSSGLKILGLAALLLSAPAPAAGIFEARSDAYDIEWNGITLGEGRISLVETGDGCYRYESTTEPMALVRWTYGKPHEISEFCVDDAGRIRPRHFEYVNDKREKDSYSLDFDWEARQVKTIKAGNVSMRELPEQAYDRFVLQQAVRQWVVKNEGKAQPEPVEFTMIDDDRIKTYRFAIVGRETVKTRGGKYETIRVERVDNPEKSSRFWVAPSRGYVPVRIEHIENGEVKLRMSVRS